MQNLYSCFTVKSLTNISVTYKSSDWLQQKYKACCCCLQGLTCLIHNHGNLHVLVMLWQGVNDFVVPVTRHGILLLCLCIMFGFICCKTCFFFVCHGVEILNLRSLVKNGKYCFVYCLLFLHVLFTAK